jgi:AcrR family transcriptional regulator
MGRPTREPQILAAALAVFAERGYDGARVRDIARRAGVSEAALYCHHASKEEVALALFETHMRRYCEALGEVARDGGRTVAERVRAIAERSLRAFADEPDAFAFVVGHQGRFIGELPADFPFAIRIVESLLREGQRDGSVRAGPVRLLAALVFGCIVQPVRTVLEAPAGTISLRSRQARETVADAAWAAVAAEAPASSAVPRPRRRRAAAAAGR